MADFQAHIKQAKKNLAFLYEINTKTKDSLDWQVTCAYYVAVHLMNSRLAQELNIHYKTHVDVKKAIFNATWPTKVPEAVYTSFSKLENLSRRSRYLCNDNISSTDNNIAYITYDRHFLKALKYLDNIINYFENEYNLSFEKGFIDCIDMKGVILSHFEYRQAS